MHRFVGLKYRLTAEASLLSGCGNKVVVARWKSAEEKKSGYITIWITKVTLFSSGLIWHGLKLK